MNKEQALAEMRRLGACQTSISWVELHPSDDAQEIFQSCDKIDWLIWLLSRKCPVALLEAADHAFKRSREVAVTKLSREYVVDCEEYVGDARYYLAMPTNQDDDPEVFCSSFADKIGCCLELARWACANVDDNCEDTTPGSSRLERLEQLSDLHALWAKVG